jgi:hypothetical protein
MISSSVLVARMGAVMENFGFSAQVGFRWIRNTIDGLFNNFVGLSERKEHGLEAWALLMRLHFGAKVKVKIGKEDLEVDSTIGVRQGSCEGSVHFLFIMQAAMEALQWPDGVERPEFKTRESGVTMGENSNRKRDATPLEL